MKKLLLTSFFAIFSIVGFGQNIDCSKAFELAIKTDWKIKDKGGFDRSFLQHIKSEAFRKQINQSGQIRERSAGLGGMFKLIGKSFGLNFNGTSNKNFTTNQQLQFANKWENKIRQNNTATWLKEFAESYLPKELANSILESWDKCNSGIISLAKHRENIRVSLAEIQSSTKIELANIERLTQLDFHQHLVELEKLKNEDRLSERTYKLELARIEAKKRGLVYYIDEKDSKVIDIVMEWDRPIGGGLNPIEFTSISISEGTKVCGGTLKVGTKFDRDKRVRFCRNNSSKKVSILLETNYETTVEYYNDFSNYVENKTIKYKYGEYTGEVINDKPNGKGIYIWDDYKYDGNFENGEFIYGEYWVGNELRKKGEFKNEELHGKGEYFLSGELYKKGEFRNGKLLNGKIYNSSDNIVTIKNGLEHNEINNSLTEKDFNLAIQEIFDFKKTIGPAPDVLKIKRGIRKLLQFKSTKKDDIIEVLDELENNKYIQNPVFEDEYIRIKNAISEARNELY